MDNKHQHHFVVAGNEDIWRKKERSFKMASGKRYKVERHESRSVCDKPMWRVNERPVKTARPKKLTDDVEIKEVRLMLG